MSDNQANNEVNNEVNNDSNNEVNNGIIAFIIVLVIHCSVGLVVRHQATRVQNLQVFAMCFELPVRLQSSAPKPKLSDMTPTSQDLDAARKVLSPLDAKGARSRMQSMVNWTKTLADDERKKVIESRGEQRKAYLEAFVCFSTEVQEHDFETWYETRAGPDA